jgi:putative toxin-antitoxin system antitoxin component (TIGR02293 family)
MAVVMKREKEKNYTKEENPSSNVVSEPMIAYATEMSGAAMRTIGLMGMTGKKDFTAIRNETDFINIIRNGIPRQAMDNLMNIADLSLTEMAAIIHTSDRTLRRYEANQRLSQEQSERMIEMARLYSRGEEVMGSIDTFKEWMNTKLVAFGGQRPKDYLDTSLGIAMIMDELGRLQHGIFA